MRFLKLILLFFLLTNNFVLSQNTNVSNTEKLENKANENDKIFINNEENIQEVKENILLLMFIIIVFVVGLIVLLDYSKKIKIANKQLDFYSKENAFLLNEAHHRINNNLQIIISLISNELIKAENADNNSLQKILSKIESISTLHRHLYKSEDKKRVSLKNYLEEIVVNFNEICVEENIETQINIQDKYITNNDAMYFGLLVTELFINSIKHAFQQQESKKITLNVTSQTNNLILDFFDNGKTIQSNIVKPKLVINLAKQLKADFEITTDNGFSFRLTKDLVQKNE